MLLEGHIPGPCAPQLLGKCENKERSSRASSNSLRSRLKKTNTIHRVVHLFLQTSDFQDCGKEIFDDDPSTACRWCSRWHFLYERQSATHLSNNEELARKSSWPRMSFCKRARSQRSSTRSWVAFRRFIHRTLLPPLDSNLSLSLDNSALFCNSVCRS